MFGSPEAFGPSSRGIIYCSSIAVYIEHTGLEPKCTDNCLSSSGGPVGLCDCPFPAGEVDPPGVFLGVSF